MVFDVTRRYETRPVLAGAYKSAKTLLTHLTEVPGERAVCGKANNLADPYSIEDTEREAAPSCPTCERYWNKLHKGAHPTMSPKDNQADSFVEAMLRQHFTEQQKAEKERFEASQEAAKEKFESGLEAEVAKRKEAVLGALLAGKAPKGKKSTGASTERFSWRKGDLPAAKEKIAADLHKAGGDAGKEQAILDKVNGGPLSKLPKWRPLTRALVRTWV